MLKKITLAFLVLFIGFVLLILHQSVDPTQIDPKTQTFTFPDTLANEVYNVDSLWQLVGDNKGVPVGYELAALLAYSAYPQLRDVAIDMKLIPSGAPMEANFDIKTLFGAKKNRKYIIYLNNAKNTDFDEILLHSLPFDAQVGILAHELGHVAYYHELSTLELAKWGLLYLISDEFRATNERTTDLMPVYHGLGSQIFQYAWYVRNDSSCAELYQQFGAEFVDKYYMTDKELAAAIANHRLYP